MREVTLQEAEHKLAQLIETAAQGEEIAITRGADCIARLTVLPTNKPLRKPGSAKGVITFLADDFDAPLDDFAEYR